ncbi:MAG: glycoside hydrolase family 32 protein [Clostridia bacterium]|nr:glycoside hydrolase family 32 protein [Clostridia bacterium]
MKKRKIISIVVSLALAFGSMASLVVTADDAEPVQPVTTDEPATTEEPIKEPTILPNDWHFVDIAHNGDTIVALAKNDTIGSLQFNTQGRLYYSADGGETWKPSENQPLASNAQISSNRASQQQILYWKENNMFVAHGGASTYTSENGINWTENTALHWTTNTMFTTSGNCLIFGGQNSANATNDLTAKQFANNKFTLDAATPNYFSLVVAAKPVDSDGNVTVMVADKYVAYDLKFPYSDPAKANWSIVKKGSGTISEAMLYDAVYSQKTDQYFAVDGTEKLKAFTDAGARPQLVVSAGDTVTGVNANADGVIVGMGSGKFFYNNSDQILNSSNNTWTEITVMEGKTPATEPINNIEFLDDGSFIALGTTQIYKGSIEDGYKNINEKDEEQPTPTPTAEATPTPTTEVTPTPTAEVTPTPTTEVTPTPTAEPDDSILGAGYRFVDVARNGDTYVALARERQDEGTYDYNNPKLYYSTDGGATWTLNPFKFEDVQNNQHPISFNKPSQQQLFWWAEKNVFVVHGSAMVHTSSDGINWEKAEHLQWTGNAVLVPNGEHIILGGMTNNAGALNVTNNDRNPKDFGSTKLAVYPMTGVGVASKPADNNGNITVLELGGNSAVSVSLKYNSDGTYTWNDLVQNQNQELPMSVYDMVYAEGAEQFLAVSAAETLFAAKSSKQFVKIKVKDGANVTGVSVNDEYIVVGMSDGTMYYTENAELTADTKWTEIPVIKGATKATEEIRNFEISEDGKFIALSLRQIYEGDIHIGYKNIKDEMPIPTPAPELSISYNDGTAVITGPEGTYAVLFAAYDDAGRLIELEAVEVAEIADNGRTVITPEKFTGEEGVSGKLMLWDSLNGMTPLASAPIPFQ